MSATKSDRPDFICLAGDDYWTSNPHSRFHLARELSKDYRVLWVNSIGSRFPDLNKPDFLRRIKRKLQSTLRGLKQVDSNFWVYSPFFLPVYHIGFIHQVNAFLFRLQLKILTTRLDFRVPVLFISSPSFAPLIKGFKCSYMIYYYSDKYVAYREITHRDSIQEMDQWLFECADAVYCASQRIYENLCQQRSGVFYLPHQVDYEHFAHRTDGVIPADLASIPRPIVGYSGSLSDSNDWALIRYAAAQRPHFSFVFIGERHDSVPSDLDIFPNIHFLGKKPYSEIPVYANFFDVGLLFWQLTEWIINSNPLKLKEYLALGLPVVSVPIPEVQRFYANLVSVAATPEEFLAALDYEIHSDGEEKRQARRNAVKDDSWRTAVTQILDQFYEDKKN